MGPQAEMRVKEPASVPKNQGLCRFSKRFFTLQLKNTSFSSIGNVANSNEPVGCLFGGA